MATLSWCFQICCGPCLWCPRQVILAGLGLAQGQGITRPRDQGRTIFGFLPCSTSLKKKNHNRHNFCLFPVTRKWAKPPPRSHRRLRSLLKTLPFVLLFTSFSSLWKHHLGKQPLAKGNQLQNPYQFVFSFLNTILQMLPCWMWHSDLLQLKSCWTQGPGVKCEGILLAKEK